MLRGGFNIYLESRQRWTNFVIDALDKDRIEASRVLELDEECKREGLSQYSSYVIVLVVSSTSSREFSFRFMHYYVRGNRKQYIRSVGPIFSVSLNSSCLFL